MLNVGKMENGIVLDHIKAGASMRIYKYLNLDKLDCSVAIIKNVVSRKMGRKDMIKIDAAIDVNTEILGYVDPGVTVDIIRGGELVEKKRIEPPARLTNVIFCKNPRCITSTEQELPHVFRLADPENKIYRCVYCETRADDRGAAPAGGR